MATQETVVRPIPKFEPDTTVAPVLVLHTVLATPWLSLEVVVKATLEPDTLTVLDGHTIVGAPVSSILMLIEQVAEFPEGSVAVQVTFVPYKDVIEKVELDGGLQVTVGAKSELSEAVGVVQLMVIWYCPAGAACCATVGHVMIGFARFEVQE